MKNTLFIAFCFLSLPLIDAAPEHACGFDTKHINEKSNMWPFENYGKVFNVDHNKQRFVFIKNTVYDEKDHQKVIGRAKNCVYW